LIVDITVTADLSTGKNPDAPSVPPESRPLSDRTLGVENTPEDHEQKHLDGIGHEWHITLVTPSGNGVQEQKHDKTFYPTNSG
jgi:hypothetical protein